MGINLFCSTFVNVNVIIIIIKTIIIIIVISLLLYSLFTKVINKKMKMKIKSNKFEYFFFTCFVSHSTREQRVQPRKINKNAEIVLLSNLKINFNSSFLWFFLWLIVSVRHRDSVHFFVDEKKTNVVLKQK